jgi:DNA invertase Pin-like site-specific DNA recombinase
VSDRKRAAIYVRVSTVEQETDLQEVEMPGILRTARLGIYSVLR